MINGVLNIYKEQDFTSFDVVAKLRGILHQKKIGHTGTLDPLAEGVLVVCLGNATKLCEMLTSDTKEYEAVLKLGECSDTDDIAGEIISNEGYIVPDEDTIRDAVMSFVGKSMQIPPKYAAIKVDGKKLYEYAREGKEVPRFERPVEIFNIDIHEIDFPFVRFTVKCSKGTYIRSLCRDIGDKLGTGGLMFSLLRRQTGRFLLENSLKLHEVEELMNEGTIEKAVLPMDSLLLDYPSANIKDDFMKYLLNGNKLHEDYLDISEEDREKILLGEIFRVYMNGNLAALYRYDRESGVMKSYKMFLA